MSGLGGGGREEGEKVVIMLLEHLFNRYCNSQAISWLC